jgi:uncharacterized membrane protein YccC
VTVAALSSLALAQYLQLSLPLWAVLTAVIVTQMSVGRSLKATIDYLVGTLGGAVYGGAVAVFVPHSNEIAFLAVLALAVAPLALSAAINPSLTTAPITAIIVLMVPEITHASPIASAVDRVLEVALGGITGFVVSLVVFPSSAHRLVAERAARALDQMAEALGKLLAGLTRGLDVDALRRIQDDIGQAMVQLQAVGAEAERELSARLASGPNTAPHLRTLLRLRHDMVMIGRAAIVPLPDALGARLASPLAQVAATFTDYLRSSGAALLARRSSPSIDDVESALAQYETDIAALRREGLTRILSGDAAERLFAIGFALEQMHMNFKDLGRCIAEWAELPNGEERNTDEGDTG